MGAALSACHDKSKQLDTPYRNRASSIRSLALFIACAVGTMDAAVPVP
jgi:hypothetical protein